MINPTKRMHGSTDAKNDVQTINISYKYVEYRMRFMTNGCIFSFKSKFSLKVLKGMRISRSSASYTAVYKCSLVIIFGKASRSG
jgi:hypothetical protein